MTTPNEWQAAKQAAVIEIVDILKELDKLEMDIERCFIDLNPDASEIQRANKDIERLLSSQAHQQYVEDGDSASKKRKYNVTGNTKLRWLIDSDTPTFEKVDEAQADIYRRKLLQHYHPDKAETGNIEMFNMARHAVATGSMEMLALMVLNMGEEIATEDLQRWSGAAFRKLARMKAGRSAAVMRLWACGNKEKAKLNLQHLIDERAKLMRITVLQSYGGIGGSIQVVPEDQSIGITTDGVTTQ